MKNWIDIIRPDDYFKLIERNEDNIIPTDLRFGSNIVRTRYEEMFDIRDITPGFNLVPPKLAFHSPLYKNTDDGGLPHGFKPAAAQRYGNVTLIWGNYENDEIAQIVSEADKDMLIESIDSGSFIPHREDGFPAIIEIINLYKHYYHGNLHRVGNHPAIRADYIVASWYHHGVMRRVDGPCGITIKNYQEFWKNGKYRGFKEEDHYLAWELKNSSICEDNTGLLVTPRVSQDTVSTHTQELSEFLDNLHGKTDIFSNTYFTNAQDEICFGAEFQ